MRIVSWNMAHKRASVIDQAWKWLNDDSEADVLFLQETKWPENLPSQWRTHSFNRKLEERAGKWGTGLLCKKPGYSPYELRDDDQLLKMLRGSFLLLKPENPQDPWLGSIHSSHATVSKEVAEFAKAAEILKASNTDKYYEIEIMAHELKRVVGGAKFIVGGDLNLSLRWDCGRGRKLSENIFANLDVIGLRRLGPLTCSSELQTFWKTNSGPFQLDYFFADEDTAKKSHTFKTISEIVTVQKLSDHCPIVADFPSQFGTNF